MSRRTVLVGSLGGISVALAAAALAASFKAQAVAEKFEALPDLDPEEPEVHEAPTPKRGYERSRMEPRNTRMKMKARR